MTTGRPSLTSSQPNAGPNQTLNLRSCESVPARGRSNRGQYLYSISPSAPRFYTASGGPSGRAKGAPLAIPPSLTQSESGPARLNPRRSRRHDTKKAPGRLPQGPRCLSRAVSYTGPRSHFHKPMYPRAGSAGANRWTSSRNHSQRPGLKSPRWSLSTAVQPSCPHPPGAAHVQAPRFLLRRRSSTLWQHRTKHTATTAPYSSGPAAARA